LLSQKHGGHTGKKKKKERDAEKKIEQLEATVLQLKTENVGLRDERASLTAALEEAKKQNVCPPSLPLSLLLSRSLPFSLLLCVLRV